MEALLGRFGGTSATKGVLRKQVAGLRTSAKPRIHAAPVQHAVEAGANGRLIQAFVNVFGTLVRGPGTRKNVEAAHKVVGRTVSARAGYHTLSQSARPRAGFGSIRPVAVPRSGHNLGLNSARNFSSSRTVFENVVNNAPLGLRVLGDKDRLDMRTFKRKMKAAYARSDSRKHSKARERGRQISHPLSLASTPFPRPSSLTSPSPSSPTPLLLDRRSSSSSRSTPSMKELLSCRTPRMPRILASLAPC